MAEFCKKNLRRYSTIHWRDFHHLENQILDGNSDITDIANSHSTACLDKNAKKNASKLVEKSVTHYWAEYSRV
jgi:hypothetical protein